MRSRSNVSVCRVGVSTLLLLTLVVWSPACVQARDAQPGDSVRLKAYSATGVPLHPGAGELRVSSHLPGGTVVKVDEIDPATKWLKIRGETQTGWIVTRYVDEVVAGGGTAPLTCVIGTWNLEYLHNGHERGFPENRNGGPTYPPREDAEFAAVADIVRALQVKILVLEEVFAQPETIDDETDMHSTELERLLAVLPDFDSVIGATGGAQHIAIIYDRRHVRLNAACETDFPPERIDGKNIFDRQALIGHFTLLQDGRGMNDLAVVGVHLASGQANTRNHDRAMQLLVRRLAEAREQEWCLPHNERDILIAGDFNAGRFNEHPERFWDELEHNGWDVLAHDPNTYPPTRMSGVPLAFRESRIDYIIVTQGNGGLQGQEVLDSQATVHRELVASAPEEFRRQASDHVPVTINVRVMEDDD